MGVAATPSPKGLGPQNPNKEWAHLGVLLGHLLSQNRVPNRMSYCTPTVGYPIRALKFVIYRIAYKNPDLFSDAYCLNKFVIASIKLLITVKNKCS